MTDSRASIMELHCVGMSCGVCVRPVLHEVSVCAIAIGVNICGDVRVGIKGEIEKHSCEVGEINEGVNEEIQKHSVEVQHNNEHESCDEIIVDKSSLTTSIA